MALPALARPKWGLFSCGLWAAFARAMLRSTVGCAWMAAGLGGSEMRNLGIVALGAALAGCASSAADITPTYVSPVQYSSYNCQQLGLAASLGILPRALAFCQLRDRRLKALLGILACGYLKLLTVIVSDPHTVLVDPTVLDFANASCCHASI